MKFLPYENITYKTKLSEDEIIKRLSDLIDTDNSYGNSAKRYEGVLIGKNFKIRRKIRYQSSFLPRINGIINQEYDVTTVNVTMRLHIVVFILICIWFAGVLPGLIGSVTVLIRNNIFEPFTLIPFGMLLFAYLLTMSGFKYESIKSKREFLRIFEAEIIEY